MKDRPALRLIRPKNLPVIYLFRICLLVVPWLCATTLLSAEPAVAPAGTAYLRTLTPEPPPFGKLIQDGFPWEGVRVQRWRRDEPATDWLAVWIDLRTPGLGYQATPVHYRPGPAGTPIQAAYAQTTFDFVKESQNAPRVDLAVNTVAYWPFPAFDGSPVFLSEPVWHGDDQPSNPSQATRRMLGLFPGKAMIGTAEDLRILKPIYAIGGFQDAGAIPDGVAVRDGKPASTGDDPHARTMAGVSQDGRVLILLVADGYNPGVSVGLSCDDAARALVAAGAYQGIFFDAGGSTTLVGRDDAGAPAVLNRPAGLQKTPGTLRYVAANVGFTSLKRSGDPLPVFANWQAPCHVVFWNQFYTWGRVYPKRLAAVLAGLALALGLGAWLIVRRRRQRALATFASEGPEPNPVGMGRRLLRAGRRFATTAVVLLLLLAAIGQVVRDRWEPFFLLFYLPLPLLGAWAVVQDLVFLGRSLPKPRFGLLLLGILAVGVGSWPLVGTGTGQEEQAGRTPIRLMQWNVRWGGKPRIVENWRTIMTDIQERDPDILVLSEAPLKERGWLEMLVSEQKWACVQCVHEPFADYWYHLAVCSRWPVRREREAAIFNGRILLVTVEVPRRPLRILVVDLESNPLTVARAPSLADVQEILQQGADRGEPIDLLIGDCNTSSRSVAFDSFTDPAGDFQLASRAALGWRGTWNSYCPVFDIDHVFVKKQFTILECEMFTNLKTDHRGQLVRFYMPEEK